MSFLYPKEIFSKFKEGLLDKKTAVNYFVSYINHKDFSEWVRDDCLKYLGEMKLQGETLFTFLENLTVSDKDPQIRARAAAALILNFPDKAYKAIKWSLVGGGRIKLYYTNLKYILKALYAVSTLKLTFLLDLIDHIRYKGKIYLVREGYLDLHNLKISNIEEIERLDKVPNLWKLDLSYNKLKEIRRLEKCLNVKDLDLSNNNICEIKGLEALKKLKKLDLSDNKIVKIEGIKNLKNLDILFLTDNRIEKICESNLPLNLLTLILNNNCITEIGKFESHLNFTGLELSNNQITEVSDLSVLVDLRHLFLNNNNIANIDALSTLINLEVLYLEGNKISKIGSLRGLTKLRALKLKRNRLTEIDLRNLPRNLNSLDLSDNLISEIRGLDCLEEFSYLSYIGLDGNLFSQQRLKELKELFIDNSPKERAERRRRSAEVLRREKVYDKEYYDDLFRFE
ncbi:MAG: leucine-rich repeat domain-containing protein [Promethearchaeota archaeon]